MSSCEELVFLDGVFAMGDIVFVHYGLIYEEHRLPVGQELFNIFLVHYKFRFLVVCF